MAFACNKAQALRPRAAATRASRAPRVHRAFATATAPNSSSGAGEKKAGTETVGDVEKTAKWVIDRLKESAKASMVAELLGIEGDPELKASLLASELGLI